MSPEAIEQAARTLLDARRGAYLIDALPPACAPTTVAEGYAVQERLFALLDEPAAGWFMGCTNPEIQQKLGLDGPYCARLLHSAVHQSPWQLAVPEGVAVVLEVEFAFRLGRDLPARASAYGIEEVRAAVATVHPAIEVVISWFRDWTEKPIAWLIADNGTDGALITGPGVALGPDLGPDLESMATRLEVNGDTVRTGSGANVHGPLRQLAWLANVRRTDVGLRAGDLHNTGSTTFMYFAQPGDHAVAVFDGLDTVELTLTTA